MSKKQPNDKELAIYEKLDKAINGLGGMASMAGDHVALAKYYRLANEALEALGQKWKLE